MPPRKGCDVVWESAVDPRVGSWLRAWAPDCGRLAVSVGTIKAGMPELRADERYTLQVDAGGARLEAASTWGALHGLTTLRQLTALEALDRRWEIEDAPRFPWRGLLIDTARHFIPLDDLLNVVEGMALLKLNVLHLHLTDDQAFRFPSRAFPELVSEAAYTERELIGLVQFAAERGVRVVPELDVPGHVQSWLVARPEWGMAEVPPTTRFGVHKACLNPVSEAVYEALGVLFSEVCEIFPDEYVHIGGDEVHPAWWSESEEAQAFIAAHDLQDVGGLQAYFNRRVYELLTDLGKTVLGWDEVLHPEMPPLTVQNWRGATTRDRALARGLDCLVSAGFYLDLFYPAEMHYRYDIGLPQSSLLAIEDSFREDLRLRHVADGMAWTDQWRAEAIVTEDLSGTLLGGEACLWSELVDAATLETRLWSRLPAVAERLWSPAAAADVENFYVRLSALLETEPFALESRQHEHLVELGLSPAQARTALYLEPVKWYARLLGEEALAARLAGSEMPQARPYQADTPLNRVVDFLSPESLHARRLMSAADLDGEAAAWAALDARDWPADMQEAIAALKLVGELVLAHLRSGAKVDDQLERLYRPCGEYMVAAIPPLLQRFGA